MVNPDDFEVHKGMNVSFVVKEITEGQGFFVLPQLFSDEDIRHAKETILYLIRQQGSKATHFQVSIRCDSICSLLILYPVMSSPTAERLQTSSCHATSVGQVQQQKFLSTWYHLEVLANACYRRQIQKSLKFIIVYVLDRSKIRIWKVTLLDAGIGIIHE